MLAGGCPVSFVGKSVSVELEKGGFGARPYMEILYKGKSHVKGNPLYREIPHKGRSHTSPDFQSGDLHT